LPAADEQLLWELTERARTGGLKLTGEGGLLGKLTKMVVEGALDGEYHIVVDPGQHRRPAVQIRRIFAPSGETFIQRLSARPLRRL
jgi:hypothetical protein